MSEHLPPGNISILNIFQEDHATNQSLSSLQPHKIINFFYDNDISVGVTRNQELEVSSINNICLGYSIANHGHNLITNGIAQKRVDVLLL
jgi:hypothetical protein